MRSNSGWRRAAAFSITGEDYTPVRRLTRYRPDPSYSLSCPRKYESFDDDRGTRAGD